MTRDDIIRMAREAGAKPSSDPEKWDVWLFQDPAMERFAALVAAAEREKCAKKAERWDAFHPDSNYGHCIAKLIREME